jgi:hypothetical protein
VARLDVVVAAIIDYSPFIHLLQNHHPDSYLSLLRDCGFANPISPRHH